MAKTVIGVELKAETSGVEKSVGSFKQKLREANQELLGLTEKFGATSKEATEAAKKVAGLKDAIGDAKALSDSFSPDAPFNALGGAIQGAVSGFQALQGVQALFGSESEELNKTLVKLNAVMALSQGVNGLVAAKDAFVNLTAVVKNNTIFIKANEVATKGAAFVMKLFGQSVNTTSTSFKVLKGAIAATGIGVLILLVGEAVQAFNEFTSASDAAAESQKRLNDLSVKNADDQLNRITDKINREEKFEIARAKIAGKTDQEIFEIQQEYQRKRIRSLNDYYNSVRTIDEDKADDAIKAANKINEEGQLAELNNQIKLKEIRDNAAKKEKEDRDNAQKKLDEEKKKREEEQKKFGISLVQQKVDADADALEEGLKNAKEYDQLQLDVEQAQSNARLQISIDRANKEKELRDQQISDDKAAAEAKIQTLNLVANTTETFANLLGKQTAAGKALAIASATINTYQGASEALKANYGAFGPAAQVARVLSVAAVIATGLKQVREIAKTKVPGGGGGGSVPSAPSISSFAPQATTTSLNQQSINAIGNVAARAYVLETDVSGNQERVRRLNRAARIN